MAVASSKSAAQGAAARRPSVEAPAEAPDFNEEQ